MVVLLLLVHAWAAAAAAASASAASAAALAFAGGTAQLLLHFTLRACRCWPSSETMMLCGPQPPAPRWAGLRSSTPASPCLRQVGSAQTSGVSCRRAVHGYMVHRSAPAGTLWLAGGAGVAATQHSSPCPRSLPAFACPSACRVLLWRRQLLCGVHLPNGAALCVRGHLRDGLLWR